MNEENKQIFLKRTKSFLWRIGMMGIVAGIDFIAVNLNLFDMPLEVVGVLGLILGEISKEINNKLSK